MKTKEKFKKICPYQGSNFTKWFGDMEFEEKKTKLFTKKLPRYMNDKEIQDELKPTMITLGELYNALETADKKEWYLCYIEDKGGVLRAVDVCWDDDGWLVRAHSVEYPLAWFAGRLIFSRNPPQITLTSNK